jgi:hypothetical protein
VDVWERDQRSPGGPRERGAMACNADGTERAAAVSNAVVVGGSSLTRAGNTATGAAVGRRSGEWPLRRALT